MKFYYAWYCPFAQRVWMTLLYKELTFEYVEVDPYQESDWWLNISRQTSQIPVIVPQSTGSKQATSIIESSRILEYLEDVEPTKQPIFSSIPEQRAEQKYWIDHIGSHIVPCFYRFLKAQDDESRHKFREKLLTGVEAFSQTLAPNQAFFAGDTISAVDIALMPFAYRIKVLLKRYRDFELPKEGENWQHYHRWYQNMLQVPAFKATSLDHADYQQRLTDFYLSYTKADG